MVFNMFTTLIQIKFYNNDIRQQCQTHIKFECNGHMKDTLLNNKYAENKILTPNAREEFASMQVRLNNSIFTLKNNIK